MAHKAITEQGKTDESAAPRRQAAEPKKSDNLRKALSLLSATLESTADGILAVDRKGNISTYNRKFLALWHIPETIASTADDRQLLARVCEQLKDPGAFLKKVEQLYSQPEAESFDTIEFKNGRVFERYSQPQRVGREIIGRVWSFRDVTAFTQAVEEQRRNREIAERLAKEMAIIAEIGRLIGSTLDIDEVYERFAAEARKLIPFDRLSVNLTDRAAGTITVVYVFGVDVPGRKPGESFPLRGSVSEALTGTRTGIINQPADARETTGRFPILVNNLEVGLRSMMSVLLISRDEAIGALHFRSIKPDVYTDQDLRLAEKIGAQIAGAIANAQFFADLKNTEKSLRESEGRFRALFEQAAVGVAEIEMGTGRFLTVNRRLCEIVGRTEEELLGMTFLAITHPEDLHLHEDKTASLMAGGIGNYTLEKRYLRNDGAVVWVDIMVSPLWKPGEAPGRSITIIQDVTERKRMEEEMREMSLRDPLTELYNRRGFITLAEQQLKAANRAKRQMLLAFIDVDDLKDINDRLGHEEGDRALIDTAAIIRRTFRESDIIARLGGDEFAILAIDIAELNRDGFSSRLQQHIDEFNRKGSRPYKLAMCRGTALYDPEAPMSLDQLMSSADELMYAQKKSKADKRT
jgi:diguanylate cyclase (GGDEF)-like protein/PAS domain S-box-containing protein